MSKLPTGIKRTSSGRYGASYKYQRRDHWVGSFDTISEAVAARKQALKAAKIELNQSNTKDLTGQHFGHLTAVKPTQQRRSSSIVWLCRCDCGAYTKVTAGDLVSGNTTSCGHVNRQRIGKLERRRQKQYPKTNPTRLTDIPPISNTSGERNISVRQLAEGPRYVVLVKFKGKKHYGGIFPTLAEAKDARDKLRQRLWGPTLHAYQTDRQQ